MKKIFYFLSIVMLLVLIVVNITELINSGAIVRALENLKSLMAI